MSNEEETTETGKKKPKIGGIGQQRSQYRTIGGQRQQDQPTSTPEPERPDTRTLERQSAQELEPPDVTASKRPNVQEPEQPGTKRERHTIYLPPDLSRWIKIRAVLEDREISEIATEAIQRYRDQIEHN